MPGQALNIPIWPGSGSAVSGSTPFGFYDNDSLFQTEAPKVAEWVCKRLGYPIMDVELQDKNIYACLEEAVTEYTAQVHQFNIRDNMLMLQGQSTGSSFTGKEVVENIGKVIQISEQYGVEAGAGGNVTWRTGSIPITVGQSVYNLNNWAAVSASGETIEIKKIFHDRSPVSSRLYDPYIGTGLSSTGLLESFGWGNYVPQTQLLMMPVFFDLLRMQAVEMTDQFRKSQYSFELINNELRIFPIPTSNFTLWFQYIHKSDRSNPIRNTQASSSTGRISDYSNVPYTRMSYNQINATGRDWIKQFTLALCKETLGNIRGKYATVPMANVENGEVSLNGSELIQQSKDERDRLIEHLRENLDAVSRKSQLERQKEESVNVIEKLNNVPLLIYFK